MSFLVDIVEAHSRYQIAGREQDAYDIIKRPRKLYHVGLGLQEKFTDPKLGLNKLIEVAVVVPEN